MRISYDESENSNFNSNTFCSLSLTLFCCCSFSLRQCMFHFSFCLPFVYTCNLNFGFFLSIIIIIIILSIHFSTLFFVPKHKRPSIYIFITYSILSQLLCLYYYSFWIIYQILLLCVGIKCMQQHVAYYVTCTCNWLILATAFNVYLTINTYLHS